MYGDLYFNLIYNEFEIISNLISDRYDCNMHVKRVEFYDIVHKLMTTMKSHVCNWTFQVHNTFE